MMENYSLSDLKSVVDNGNGFCSDNGAFWLILLFLFFGINGNGNFGGAGATAAAQNELLLGQNFDRVGQKLDGIANGMCNSTYDLNNSIKECLKKFLNAMKDFCTNNAVGTCVA